MYKRVFDTPKNGKIREGAISDGTSELLKEWVELAQETSAEGICFPEREDWPRRCRPTTFGVGR